MGMSGDLEVSLEGEDEIIASISMKSVRVIREEFERLLGRCESEIAAMLSAGQDGSQKLRDRVARREKLRAVLDEIIDVEASVRLTERSQGGTNVE